MMGLTNMMNLELPFGGIILAPKKNSRYKELALKILLTKYDYTEFKQLCKGRANKTYFVLIEMALKRNIAVRKESGGWEFV